MLVQLNRRTFAGAQPEGNGVEDLALTLAHETRHCEQWFRMARLEAGRGKPAGQITREMGFTNAGIALHAASAVSELAGSSGCRCAP